MTVSNVKPYKASRLIRSCNSHTVRLGRPGGSGGPRWPRLSEMLEILGGPERLRIVLPPPRCHPGRPGCSGADPGIIPGENILENPGSSWVFPVSSRRLPGVPG